jgi:hypothetical protein
MVIEKVFTKQNFSKSKSELEFFKQLLFKNPSRLFNEIMDHTPFGIAICDDSGFLHFM